MTKTENYDGQRLSPSTYRQLTTLDATGGRAVTEDGE